MSGRSTIVRLSWRPARSGRAAFLPFLVVAFGLLLALLGAFPSPALAASPHADSAALDTCESCHVPHKAATAESIFKDVGQTDGEITLCFVCHDGSGANSDVKHGPDSFGQSSGHVLESRIDTTTPTDLTNACSSCHSPHKNPTTSPNLPGSTVNSVTVGTTGNGWCLACHNDGQDWYKQLGTYPPLASPARDATGYPVAGVFAGASVYTNPAKNAHIGIPASAATSRTAGDCLYCHNAHGSTSRYDSLSATLAPSSAGSAGSDRQTGNYAALCFGCHGGGSWEASGAANIKQYVTHEASQTSDMASGGHRIKSSGGTLPPNAPLPCYNCHNPHGSSRGNTRLISDALGASLDTSAGPEAVRTFCLTCHVTSDLFGWESVSATYTAVSSTATVEGLKRNGGTNGSGPGGNGKNWLLLKVTPGHQKADASMSCYECHGSDYTSASSNNVHDPGSYSVALHTANPPTSTITILGVGYDLQVCADCHDLELGPEHAVASSSSAGDDCATCHPTPRSSLTPGWDHTTCAQANCHAGSSTAPMHDEANADHTSPVNACTAVGCHTAAWGLAALHSSATTTVAGDDRASCAVCHGGGVPTTRECSVCHAGLAHPDFDHTVAGPCTAPGCHGTDAKATHDAGPKCAACHAPGVTPTLSCGACHAAPHPEANHGTAENCTSCHSTGNLMGVHKDDCTSCHPVPAQTTTYADSCSQAGCHPGVHADVAGHNSDHGEGDDCFSCHPGDGGNCDSCHSAVYERLAPITTSDARESYVNLAFIRLTAVDQGEWGWASGVQATYYQVDGGPIQTGATVVVNGPASGSKNHTVEFWSTDWHYNTETHKVVYFTIAAGPPDTNPPTGTMSVNNGATWARNINATVNSAVADGETGVASMRVDSGVGAFGAWVDYAPTYPIVLPATNNMKTVRAEYRDAGGNVVQLSDTILLDNTLPTGTMTVNSGAAYTSSLTVTITSAVTDAYSGLVDVRYMDNSNWVWTAWEPYSATKSRTLGGTFINRGIYVQYRDAAGNILQLVDGILYDGVAPTGTMSVNNNATYATVVGATLNSAVTDTGGSLLSQMRVDPGSGAFGAWIPYNSAYPFTLAAGDGVKTVRAEYRDGAGHVLAKSDTIVLDTVGPTGSMVVASGAATTSVTAVNVNSSVTDAGSGMNQMRVDPGTGVFGSWIAYAATYGITLPSGTGTKTVRVEYSDNVSRTVVMTDTVYLDTGGADGTPPTGSIVINGNAPSTTATAAILTLSASDTGGSGLTDMRFSNDNSAWSTWEAYATSKNWTLTEGGGTKTVYVQFRDGASNASIAYSDDILFSTGGAITGTTTLAMTDYTWVDSEPGATGEWGTFTIYLDGVQIGTKPANATTTWICPQTAASPGARIDIVASVGFTTSYDYDWNTPLTFTTYLPGGTTQLDAAVWTGFPNLEVNDSWYQDYEWDYGSGDYRYVLVPPATISGINYTASLSADTTPPVGTVAINGAAPYTNGTAASLTLSASDTGGVGVSDMRFSADNSTWSSWEAYATTKSWTLAAGSGLKTVYVQFRDAAGNASSSASDTITLDGVAPTGSVSVNAGSAWATSTLTTLALSGSDVGGSAVADMRFSNDGSSWGAWGAYSTSANWTLAAGEGAKTVYAQYRDGAGNVSTTSSDGISLDSVKPLGFIEISSGAVFTNDPAVSLGLSSADTGGSGIYQMRFSNDNSTWSAWQPFAWTSAWTLSAGDGTKTVYAQFSDVAGNVSTTYSDSILFASGPTATLQFDWWSEGSAILHVENDSGVTIASTSVEGYDSDLSWTVVVPAGENYYMVCDYYDDWEYGGYGGGYGVWSNDVSINPDGILSPGETVTWNY